MIQIAPAGPQTWDDRLQRRDDSRARSPSSSRRPLQPAVKPLAACDSSCLPNGMPDAARFTQPDAPAAGRLAMTVTLTTLVSFDFPIGAAFAETLIADANGDLFGTTEYGADRRHGVRDRQYRHRSAPLRQHADHAGQLQRRQRLRPSEAA